MPAETRLPDRRDVSSDPESSSATPRRPEPGSTRKLPPSVRRRSERMVLGFPLWEIARGPDPSRGETVGHARAIFAAGDIADGVVAVGGISRGVISIGGVAFGLITLGGISLSLLGAIGGVALAPLAYGGVAVGGVSVGGAAVGVYAKGGAASGRHVIDRQERDPEAERLFRRIGVVE